MTGGIDPDSVHARYFLPTALPPALVPTIGDRTRYTGGSRARGSRRVCFALAGQTVSLVACALGGYAVLMALVQVRLIPVYRRLSFTPGPGTPSTFA
jgi:tellurite resistance protein